ncbi:MAG: SDR family NAD(P)-dependent oxidoreductase [Mycobacteriaceae bacterium]
MSDGSVLILGGRSEIGIELANLLAPGRTLILAARRAENLDNEVAMLELAGATRVITEEFDADNTEHHQKFLLTIVEQYGPIGVAVLAFGVLGNQQQAEVEAAHALAVIHTDYVAQVSVLTHLGKLMRKQGNGSIIIFSSVAGIRVRQANYVYGSAKAGLDGFASGFSDALHSSGVQVLTARPGFVIGRMTAEMAPAPFSRTPRQVAHQVYKALDKGKSFVWIPGTLRPVFFVMKLLPQVIWRRLPR